MAELGDEELSLKKPEPREPQGKTFSDFGWYITASGYRAYGKIPKSEAERMKSYKPRVQDAWLYKDEIL